MSREKTIFSRHTQRADKNMGYSLENEKNISSQYTSITKEGVRKAREMANSEFGEIVDNMDKNGILFIGGASEEIRTKETAEVIGDQLSKKYQDEKGIDIFTKENINNLREQAKEEKNKFINKIKKLIENHPDQKLVFTYPLFLKEFSLRPHHRDKKTGEHSDYIKTLLKKTGYDKEKALMEWFKNKGKISDENKEFKVPSPQKTAENHLLGIERLRSFAKKITNKRSIDIGLVGHAWQLDALAVYLANNGQVSAEAFKKYFKNKGIKQPEAGRISIEEDKAVFTYRGEEYPISQEIFDLEEKSKK